MIVSCPSCTARYDLGDEYRGSPSFSITCQRCGHRWKELPLIEINESSSRALTVSRNADTIDEQDFDVQSLVAAAKASRESFLLKRKAKIKRLTGWASLGLIATFPFVLAGWVPETVVAAAPYTIKAYQRLGFEVNVYGLEIRHIEQQNRIIDGAHVLLIKGEISNPTNDIRKIPWLRFGLSGEQGQELYKWTLDTASRPLRPGETTSFTTRVADPPQLAKNLQIRFAHQDEIGSKTGS